MAMYKMKKNQTPELRTIRWNRLYPIFAIFISMLASRLHCSGGIVALSICLFVCDCSSTNNKVTHIIHVQSRKSEYNGKRLFKPPPSYLCKCHVISTSLNQEKRIKHNLARESKRKGRKIEGKYCTKMRLALIALRT